MLKFSAIFKTGGKERQSEHAPYTGSKYVPRSARCTQSGQRHRKQYNNYMGAKPRPYRCQSVNRVSKQIVLPVSVKRIWTAILLFDRCHCLWINIPKLNFYDFGCKLPPVWSKATTQHPHHRKGERGVKGQWVWNWGFVVVTPTMLPDYTRATPFSYCHVPGTAIWLLFSKYACASRIVYPGPFNIVRHWHK